MESEPKKAILVIRVSHPSQERDGLSLDHQELVLREYARDHNLIVEEEFRFQETADRKIRSKFQQVIKLIRSRRDVVALVGFRVDRLTRNYRDHVEMDDLRLEHGKELHFVHDRLVIAKNTVGLAIQQWDTQVYLAKMHLNRLKADAEDTANFKLGRNEIVGKAPFGYLNTVGPDGRTTVTLNPAKAAVVKRAYALYSSGGASMGYVRAKIRKEFGIELSNGRVYHILRNPFYIGQMRYRGKLYPHRYEHLVTHREFEEAQKRRVTSKEVPRKFAGLPFPYRGLISCAMCGCRITCERKRKAGKEYVYYHCTEYKGKHAAAWISESTITKIFQESLDGLRIPNEVCERIQTRFETESGDPEERRKHAIQEIESKLKKYELRLEELYEDKLDGAISKDFYQRKRAEYEEVRADLVKEKSKFEERNEPIHIKIATLFETCRSIGELFAVAKHDKKRRILSFLLSNCELDGKRLLWELKEPFRTVLSCNNNLVWGPLEDMFLNPNARTEIDFEMIGRILEGEFLRGHAEIDPALPAKML